MSMLILTGCDLDHDAEKISDGLILVIADAGQGTMVKTSISYDENTGYSSDWLEDDVLGFYYLEEGSEETAGARNRGELYLGTLGENGRSSFTGSVTKPEESVEYVFNAYFPSSAYSSVIDNSLMLNEFRFTVPNVQYPVAGGFDPQADILIARPVKKIVSPEDESVSLDFNFERVVAIMRINFPAISYEGVSEDEKIMQVNVSKESAEGNAIKNLIAGRVKVDPTAEPMTLSSFSNATYSLHSITANYNSENAPTLAEGNVYITLVPRILSAGDKLIVKVTTDKHIITKTSVIPEGKYLDFPANAVKTVKVNIDQNAAVEALAEDYYIKVTDISQITSEGHYILVYDMGAKGMVATDISEKKINATEVAYVEGKGYRVTEDLEACDVRFEPVGDGMYYIKVADKYVVYSGSSTDLINNISESEDENGYKWSISVEDDGVNIVSAVTDTRSLKYSTSGEYYKAYASGSSYKLPQLYIHP